MNEELKFNIMSINGKGSIDGQIKHLIKYVNEHINQIRWENRDEAVNWGKKTIEQGMQNIVSNFFAYLE